MASARPGERAGDETEYSAVCNVRDGRIVHYREYANRKKALEAVGLRE